MTEQHGDGFEGSIKAGPPIPFDSSLSFTPPRPSTSASAMVAENPLFQGSLSRKKLQATVVNDIWPEVLFFTLIATSKVFLPI